MVTIKGNTYQLKRTFTDDLYLAKNGSPILYIPDEIMEDFIQILSNAAACEKFLTNSLTDKTNENEKDS